MYFVLYIIVTLLSVATFVMEFSWTIKAKHIIPKGSLHTHFEPLGPFANCNDSLDFAEAIKLSQSENPIHFNDRLWFKQIGLCELILLFALGFIMIKLILLQPLPWTVLEKKHSKSKKVRKKSSKSSKERNDI